jgi:protein-tyrosine phosphatase
MSAADLHFHLLPGVDDGPSDMEESVELARAAAADGTGTVVATPHVRSDCVTAPLELRDRVEAVRAAIAEAGVDLEVRSGGEVAHEMVERLRHDELEALAQGPPGARWILLETPFGAIGEDFHAASRELRERGFGVVLGHPERGADVALCGAAGLRRELAAGSLAQVNAMSLAGGHGEDAEVAAIALVAEGRVTVVASDAHGPTRPPALAIARRAMLDREVPASVACALTESAARRLLTHGVRPSPALVHYPVSSVASVPSPMASGAGSPDEPLPGTSIRSAAASVGTASTGASPAGPFRDSGSNR